MAEKDNSHRIRSNRCFKPRSVSCGRNSSCKSTLESIPICPRLGRVLNFNENMKKNTKPIASEMALHSNRTGKRITNIKASNIQEPDSTSASFLQKHSKQKEKHGVNNRKTWFDVLQNQDAHSGNDEMNNIPVLKNTGQFLQNNTKSNVRLVNIDVNTNNTLENDDKINNLNVLVNELHKKISKTGNDEMLRLIENINYTLESLPYNKKTNKNLAQIDLNLYKKPLNSRTHQDACKNQKCDKQNYGRSSRCIPDTSKSVNCHKNNKNKGNDTITDENLDPKMKDKYSQILRLINEKKLEFLEDVYKEKIKVDAFKEMQQNLMTVNTKTDEYKKAIQNLEKLMINIHADTKEKNEIKDIKTTLETKLSILSCENKYLKNELQHYQEERNKMHSLLEDKSREIRNLKENILKIKDMVTIGLKLNSKYKPKNPLQNVVAELLESYTALNDINDNDTAYPVSSSPLNTSYCNDSLITDKINRYKLSKGDNDSGIQSNTPEKLQPPKNNIISTLKNNFENIFSKLEEDLKIKNLEDKKGSSQNIACDVETSFNLSETTYQYSAPSVISEQVQ